MANRKISDLTALTAPATGDLLPIVDISEAAAAPSVAFEGDNTGIYSPGADQLAIATGGTGRLFVDASGNVASGSATFLKPFTITNQNAAISLRANSSGTYSDQGIFFAVDGTNYAQIYNEGTGKLIFRTGSGLSERLRIDGSGRLLVGTSTARSVGGGFQSSSGSQLFIEAGATDLVLGTFVLNRNDINPASIVIGKSRGTAAGGNTILQNNDFIGRIIFAGADGTDVQTPAAFIEASVDGTPGVNDMPCRLVFSTTADGAASPTEAMRIKSTQIINFSNAPTHADNTAATAAGLAVGDVYKTVLGALMIRF